MPHPGENMQKENVWELERKRTELDGGLQDESDIPFFRAIAIFT